MENNNTHRERANKPADNGGDACTTTGYEDMEPGCCEYCRRNEPRRTEVIGGDSIEALKREIEQASRDRKCAPVSRLSDIDSVVDYLASRNLLKSEGVCVPGEVIETLKSIKLQTEFFTQEGISEDVLRNTLKQIDIIVSEALRPFLPAEKE